MPDEGSIGETIGSEVSGAAFRRLLRTGTGAEIAELAGDLRLPAKEVATTVEARSCEV